jgi:hypothetical protein
MSEAAKEAHIPPVEGEKMAAFMENDKTNMMTNSYKEIARVLGNSDRTNPRVSSISQWIGCAIIEGRLRPGDDLNTVDLSKQFQTSRTPVKESLCETGPRGSRQCRTTYASKYPEEMPPPS